MRCAEKAGANILSLKFLYLCVSGVLNRMEKREEILSRLVWDYKITAQEVDAVLKGQIERAGHYTRSSIFLRLIESFPWFTVLSVLTPEEVRDLLTRELIRKIRSPYLRSKYEFIRQRLQAIIPAV